MVFRGFLISLCLLGLQSCSLFTGSDASPEWVDSCVALKAEIANLPFSAEKFAAPNDKKSQKLKSQTAEDFGLSLFDLNGYEFPVWSDVNLSNLKTNIDPNSANSEVPLALGNSNGSAILIERYKQPNSVNIYDSDPVLSKFKAEFESKAKGENLSAIRAVNLQTDSMKLSAADVLCESTTMVADFRAIGALLAKPRYNLQSGFSYIEVASTNVTGYLVVREKAASAAILASLIVGGKEYSIYYDLKEADKDMFSYLKSTLVGK